LTSAYFNEMSISYNCKFYFPLDDRERRAKQLCGRDTAERAAHRRTLWRLRRRSVTRGL